MKKISTGIENFKKIIDENYYYVDKSQFIEVVLEDQVTLFTRPRRFGKTLNMSMLYYFFSNKEKENAYLFDGLKITQNKDVMKLQNQFPVISITLKDIEGSTYDACISSYRILISNLYKKFSELKDSEMLDSVDKSIYNSLREMTSSISILQSSLQYLSHFLEAHYHQKVIILIDEYDVPLQAAYYNNYYDELVHFFKNTLSSALKTNDSLYKGIMTGCLRIAKESIFTGLNNFNVYSIFNKGLSSVCFGFTQKEIDDLLNDYHVIQYKDKMKEWYDGYLFGNTEIYNPWSSLKYVQQIIKENDFLPQSYWANTSSNDIVYNYIQNSNREIKNEFELLIQGKAVTKTVSPEITYRDMDNINNIYSFLLFTGYLKVKKQIDDENHNTYQLVIPNKEVYEIYKNQFIQYFNDYTRDRKKELVDALIDENVEQANLILNDILDNSISFYDNYESFYHGFIMGLFSSYNTRSNQESGDGRYDIGIFPGNIFKPCVIIEVKKANQSNQLIKCADEAVEQIKKKRYIKGVKNDGYVDVKAYGISFYEKSCYIKKV